ncbi:MAG: response regulator transcription factor [Duodenibacillus sp.]|nr:response regulator transcription factor [Duodenibacillus sp.]
MTEALVRIVDDDPQLLASQKYLLQIAGFAVATYPSCLAFLEKDDFRKPGCLVLDVRMPEMTGLELQTILENRGSKLPVIFLSAHGSINMAVHTVKHGAFDFLEKPADPDAFIEIVGNAVAASLKHSETAAQGEALQTLYDSLTGREKDVIALVSKGMSNRDVAESLGISLPTVKMHRGRAMAKLGMKSPVEADAFLRKLGVNKE